MLLVQHARLILWASSILWGASGIRADGAEASAAPQGPHEFLIQNWGIDEGLPQSSVTAIVQTPDAYLWFGTFDGLVRFDGVRFIVSNPANTPGLGSGSILKLFVDRSGRLWIGTRDDSISILEKGVFRTIPKPEGVPVGASFSFVETAQGDVLYSGSTFGVRKYDGNHFVQMADGDSLKTLKASLLERDTAGVLYGLRNDSAGWFDRTNWFDIATAGGQPVRSLQATAPARDGGIWVTANGQVTRIQNGSWVQTLGQAPWTNRIRAFSMLEDSNRALWIGTYGAGLFRRSGSNWTRISHEEGLPNDVIRAIFEDHEGSIWVGTDGGGLVRLKPRLFTNYSRKDGLPENIIDSVREVSPGELWIGTHGGGLARMRGSTISRIETSPTANNRWIFSLEVDRTGVVWAGTYGPKLFSFPNGNYTEVELPEPQDKQSVNAIFEDSHGALWVGTHNGLFRRTNGILTQFTTNNGLSGNIIRSILEMTNSTVWFGTENGLTRFQDGRFSAFVGQPRLKSIRGLFTADGALWAGTGRGLARIKNDHCVIFERKDGLPHDEVESMLSDDLGNMWIAGDRGICRIRLSDLDAFAEGSKQHIEAFLYGKGDGLGSGECPGGHQPNAWKGSDGRLWFGTVGGLSVIDPRNVKPNTISPQVWIEEVMVDAKAQRSPLTSSAERAIIAEPGSKQIEIHYTGLSFIAPGQVLFKYRLDEFDHDWTMVGNRRVAYFQGLRHGHYQFRVTACNNDGVWNPVGASIGIIVQPFFHETMWFRVSTILATGLLILFAYRRRISFLKREHHLQQEFSLRLIASQEQERKRLASEIHDGLGQNLLIIKNRAVAAKDGGNTISIPEQLEEISRSASDAIQEVRTIAHNLRPYQLDRLGLTMALQAIAKQFASNTTTLISQIDPVNKVLPPDHEINFYRIIQESLNNIIKHSGAKNAFLTVRKEPTRVVVSIRDDGKGFDYLALINDPTSKRGLGLTGLMERARGMNADLRIESAPGQGTRLTLIHPISIPDDTRTA